MTDFVVASAAAGAKVQGNAAFKAKEYDRALELYRSALDLLPDGCSAERIKLLSNIAMALLKMELWQEAVKAAQECMQEDWRWAKAYLYKAVALAMLAEQGESQAEGPDDAGSAPADAPPIDAPVFDRFAVPLARAYAAAAVCLEPRLADLGILEPAWRQPLQSLPKAHLMPVPTNPAEEAILREQQLLRQMLSLVEEGGVVLLAPGAHVCQQLARMGPDIFRNAGAPPGETGPPGDGSGIVTLLGLGGATLASEAVLAVGRSALLLADLHITFTCNGLGARGRGATVAAFDCRLERSAPGNDSACTVCALYGGTAALARCAVTCAHGFGVQGVGSDARAHVARLPTDLMGSADAQPGDGTATRVLLRECAITACPEYAGVDVREGAQLLDRGSTVKRCKRGIVLRGRPGPTLLRGTRVAACEEEGVLVEGVDAAVARICVYPGEPMPKRAVLRACSVQKCGAHGMVCRGAGFVTELHKCRLSTNAFQGMLTQDGAEVTLRKCAVSENWCGGVYVDPTSGPVTIADCTLEGNGGPAVRDLARETEAHVQIMPGVPAPPLPQLTLSGNDVSGNSAAGARDAEAGGGDGGGGGGRRACANCGVTEGKLKPCSKCLCTYFCGNECVREAWREFHKQECAQLAAGLLVLDDWSDLPYTTNFRLNPACKDKANARTPSQKLNTTIIKVQTVDSSTDPNQLLRVYDASHAIDSLLRSPALRRLVLQRGVLGLSPAAKKAYLRVKVEYTGDATAATATLQGLRLLVDTKEVVLEPQTW